jgi:hypothetical protein
MTAATLMHHHRVVRAALNQAKRWKYIPENPADDVQLDSGGRAEMQVPTAVQARALILRAAGTFSPDLGPILLFAMLTGMRRGNCAGSNGPISIGWDPGSRCVVRYGKSAPPGDSRIQRLTKCARSPSTRWRCRSSLPIKPKQNPKQRSLAYPCPTMHSYGRRRLTDSLHGPRTVSRGRFTVSVERWKPKRLPLIPHEWSHGSSASTIFVI